MGDKIPDQPTPEEKQTENQAQQPETPHHASEPSVVEPVGGEPSAQTVPASGAHLRQDQEALAASEVASSVPAPESAPDSAPASAPRSESDSAPDPAPGVLAQEDARSAEDASSVGPLSMEALATDAPAAEAAAPVEGAAPRADEQEQAQSKIQEPGAASDAPSPSGCFRLLSWLAPLMPVLLAIILLAPLIYQSKITGIAPQPEAAAQAAAVAKALHGGDLSFWFVPHVEGRPDSGVLPMQLWWGALMDGADHSLSGLAGEWAKGWSGPALLTWLFLTAVVCLGWTDSRFGRQGALAAALAAVSSLPVVALAWFGSGLLLAPAFSVLAAACLLRGLKKTTFSLSVFAGCVCMALAALSGGLIFAAAPLAAALVAIAGTLNFRRLGEWDLVFGLGLTALILGAWLTGGLLFAGSTALREYLSGLSLFMGVTPAFISPPPGCLASLLGIGLLPWLALPLLMPARSGKALLGGVKDWKNRIRFTEPLFLGGLVLAGAAGLALSAAANASVFVLLLAAVIALAVRSLTNLSPRQNCRWSAFCALYLLVLGGAFLWLLLDSGRETLNAHLGIAPNIYFGIKTWLAPAAAAIIGALTLWFFGRGKSSQAGLLVLAFAALLLGQSFAWLSLPVIQPYLKSAEAGIPAQDIVLPVPEVLPDGPRLHLPMPPETPLLTPPAQANQNATQGQITQPDILGAPMPAVQNATAPGTPAPGTPNDAGGGAIPAGARTNATLNAPPAVGVPGEAAPLAAPPAQNATVPVPEAGNALYGDDLPPLTPPTGPPPAPYQPGLQTAPRAQEPPLPLLDTPRSAPAPAP